MPGAREILSFVLETDATKAVKGFEQTESSAEKMGTTITKVGAVVAGAGLAVGAGLFGMVKQFEQAEVASNKFATAVRGTGSKIDTQAIKRLASDLQQVSTVTNDSVIAAARWGAVYGLTTRQLEELLRVAVDLSAQTGKSLDVVTKGLAKAASGEGYTALTKLGLTFDETAYKADSFGTTVSEATAFAAGAAEAQVNTMSGQLTRLGNNWDDVKEQIGKGANEVFEPLAKAGADFSEKIAESNPELLEFVGHFTAIGSVAATAFGTLATIGGQVANLREGFAGLSGLGERFGLSMKDAQGNTTKFGSAMSGVGKGAGIALGALGVAGLMSGVAIAIDEATQNARELDTAFKEISAAKTTNDIAAALERGAKANHGFLSGVQDFISGVDSVNIEGIEIPLRNLGQTIKEFGELDPAAGLKATGVALESLNRELDNTDDMGQRLQIEEAITQLEKSKVELEANKDATGELAESDEELAEATESATQAIQKLGDVSRGQIDPVFSLLDANQQLADAQMEVVEAEKEHGRGSPEHLQALRDAAGAALDADLAAQGLAAAVRDGTTSYPQAIARLGELKEQGRLSEQQFKDLSWQVYVASLTVQNETGQDFDINTDPAIDSLEEMEAAMKRIFAATDASMARVRNLNPFAKPGTASAAPAGTVPTTYASATAPVGSVSNVTINLPPGTPTSRTLSELRRYRRGGGDMSGLIDSIVAVR